MAPNWMFQQLSDKTKKKKKHRPFYEAVDAHARRRLKKKRRPFYEAAPLKKHRPFYEAVDAHARRRLMISNAFLFSILHKGYWEISVLATLFLQLRSNFHRVQPL